MKKDLNRYLTEVGEYLICSKRQKKIILENLQTSIRDYVEYENVQDISAVYNHFGSPEDIAKTYLANFVKPADVKKALNKKKVFIVGVVVALLIWLIAVVFALIDSYTKGPVVIIHGPAIEVEEGVDTHDENYEVIS